MTLPTALAAPVEAGMMFWCAPRPSRQALALGPSTVFWVAVYAWTVVYTEERHVTFKKSISLEHSECQTVLHLAACLTYHECLLNAIVVMDDFGQGGQAVGGAGSIANNAKTNMVTTHSSRFSSLHS